MFADALRPCFPIPPLSLSGAASAAPPLTAAERESAVMAALQRVRSLSKTRDGLDLARAFKRFDTNGDRRLDAAELRAALTGLGVPTDARCASAIVAAFDRDGSGSVDYGEFLYAFFNRRDVVAKWRALATGGEGKGVCRWVQGGCAGYLVEFW